MQNINVSFVSREDELHFIGQNSVKGMGSVINDPLVPKEKIIIPPLHIKLGLVRSFVVSLRLTEESDTIKILKNKIENELSKNHCRFNIYISLSLIDASNNPKFNFSSR